MKKLAIFSEGQTEQLLSEQAVLYVAGEKKVTITKIDAMGGSRNNPRVLEIKAETDCAEYFVLIVNCGTDNRVKSDIIDRYESLVAAGYEKIIGIRDVYPFAKYDELSRLRSGLSTGLPVGLSKILFVLGVMEIEAWILAEHTHFPKIHSKITLDRILKELGIDVINHDLAKRENPSKDLSDIYWLEAIEYNKSRIMINRILDAISLSNLQDNVASKFEDLLLLWKELEIFFSKG